VIFIMAVTGSLLAFERQINVWADGHRVTAPSANAKHIPAETLLGGMEATPTALTLRSDPTAPAEAAYGRERTVMLNPYTGEVLGEASKRSRDFFALVERLHRTLGAQGESRAFGRAFTGASNFAFLFIVISGPILWWPKQWTWSRVKPTLLFRRGVDGRARDWNWHNVIGIWCALPLFIIVLSGVIMSYQWANDALYRITGNQPPVRRAGGPERLGRPGGRSDPGLAWAGLNSFWTRAEQEIPGWKSISLRFPNSPRAPLTFSIDAGNGDEPQKRATLTFDRKTGETQRETFSSNNLGRQLRTLARFSHTGEAGGMVGVIVAFLASTGAAVLTCTGIMLAVLRLYRFRRRKSPEKEAVVALQT
jgi:uncharacterized iron-regulated membrane protein